MNGCRPGRAGRGGGAAWALVAALTLTGCAGGLTTDERAARVNVELGMAYLEESNIPAALSTLTKAVGQNPRDPGAHMTLAIAYARAGERERAAEHFLHAVRLDPADASVRNNYGVFLCEEQRYEEAERQFVLAVASPRYASPELALTNAGACARSAGEYRRAQHHLEQALVHAPNYPPALYQLARLALVSADPLGARGWIVRLEQRGPLDAAGLELAAVIDEALGEGGRAAGYRRELQSRYPDGPAQTGFGLSRQQERDE